MILSGRISKTSLKRGIFFKSNWLLVFILTLVNNLHYSIEKYKENKNYKSLWNSIIKNNDNLLKFTRNFDETMIIIYFILIIIYIHYS